MPQLIKATETLKRSYQRFITGLWLSVYTSSILYLTFFSLD